VRLARRIRILPPCNPLHLLSFHLLAHTLHKPFLPKSSQLLCFLCAAHTSQKHRGWHHCSPLQPRSVMTKSLANSKTSNDSARCQHRTMSGKRCRLRVVDPHSGLCFRYSAKQSELPHAADLRSLLAGEVTQFECAYDINKFLSNLLLLLSEGLYLQSPPPHPRLPPTRTRGIRRRTHSPRN